MTLTVRTVPATQLRLDPANAREHSERNLRAIADSLEEFGQVTPLVVTPDLVIAAGNGTFLAGRDLLGWTHFDVVESAPAQIERAKALAIAMNRSAELASWDESVLLVQLEELAAAGLEPARLGFTERDLVALRPPGVELEDDPVPARPKRPRTQLGDLVQLGDHRVLCGDATDPACWRRLMDGRVADLVFTDPPYGMSYRPAGHEPIAGDDLRRDDLVTLVASALKASVQHSSPRAAFYVWHASSTRDDFKVALDSAGLEELEYLVWAKPSAGPGNAHYRRSHEPCFYAGRAGVKPRWFGDRNQQTVWRAAVRSGDAGRATVIAGGLLVTDHEGHALWITDAAPKKRVRHLRLAEGEHLELQSNWAAQSVWEVGRDAGIDHPTPKPVELVRRALENSSAAGGLVIDPFLGSGSTLIGAERTGRACYGLELDPRYVDVIVTRWEALTGLEAVR